MSTPQTVMLGAVAGLTIYIGLPLGRVRATRPQAKAFLNAVSAGILVFLLFDILAHATEPVEQAAEQAKEGASSWSHAGAMALVYVVGLGVGLLGLLYLGRFRLWSRPARPGGIGPGAMAATELVEPSLQDTALRTGMAIATGIGLHNFSEGLAIGQAARGGAMSLAGLLIVGFGLHNMTEGFGIVGPLAAAGVRPSWGWLAVAGLIGGGPTFAGTLLGTTYQSELVFVGFLTLAAGAILYVIGEVLPVGRRLSWELTLWGLLAGFVLGLATDLVLALAGG